MNREEIQELEERIRRRAHEIWEREGRPEGRSDAHWELAREEIAIEDNQKQALNPNPSKGPYDTATRPEPVEPLVSVENLGEGFGPAGQEDPQPTPSKRTRTRRNKADNTE